MIAAVLPFSTALTTDSWIALSYLPVFQLSTVHRAYCVLAWTCINNNESHQATTALVCGVNPATQAPGTPRLSILLTFLAPIQLASFFITTSLSSTPNAPSTVHVPNPTRSSG
ncbi:uncharacterized protein BP01DRAFT_66473 [Aspergillus saccharolyticus JOP 1030-1]|uniref:Uncharacterized protein n=1 Tax=Aspergillus saccharolyticus JOP 1030-1 TaxID=1450539 RepID=A0A318ZJP9_9EURO|nr:hypothetical protein BP01DRAFT_66473 [Aspergillus saccharolyticus JOP 1030-1]PYH44783.1 hypothetical protein BP01DRAFT_66473 [Aspergillus saccharolyticus JOP 1030-1]